jgi:hypothetical protein
MGFDCGPVEVFIHADCFGCRSDDKVHRVPYAVTTDPRKAAELCFKQGLDRHTLEYETDYLDAERLYQSTVPVLK